MRSTGLFARLVVSLGLWLVSTSVFAVMSIPYGWYLEANAGSANLTKKSYPGDASTSGLGGNVNFGYKFFPYMGVEAGYSQYPNSTISTPSSVIPPNAKAATDKHYSYDLAVKGIYPICQTGLELFGKLGGGHVTSNMNIKNATAAAAIGVSAGNHNDTSYYLGAGAQYYFIPELAVVVQWQRANGSSATGTWDLYSGGLSLLVG